MTSILLIVGAFALGAAVGVLAVKVGLWRAAREKVKTL